MIIVRYADDFALGFQYCNEAERFIDALKHRLEQFGLAQHLEQTCMLEFGCFTAENRTRRGAPCSTRLDEPGLASLQ